MKKRILIFSEFPDINKPTYYSFIKTRVLALKDLCEVVIVKVNITDGSYNEKVSTIQEDGYQIKMINIRKVKVPKIRVPLYDFLIKNQLDRLVKEINPDIIHVHFTSYYSWIVNKIAKKLNIPYCITEHATFFEDKINHKYYGPRMKMALHEANTVISVSNPLRKIMEKYIHREIIVKPNIIDVDKFTLKENTKGKRDDITRIVSVGSLNRNDKKGYEILIESLKLLKDQTDKFHVQIIGDGENKEKLEGLIHEYGLEKNVSLLGSISNELLQEYYHQADFYVSSSRKETFGVVLLEALSCGLPVVSTISGGPEDFVNEHVGILVDKESSKSLYKGLEYMIAHFPEYEPKMLRDYVVTHYSFKAYQENTLRIYNGILQND